MISPQNQGGMDSGGDPGAPLTFSVVRSLSGSWRRWLNTMVNTACERLLVSFMFVAATVLRGSLGGPSVPEGGVWGVGGALPRSVPTPGLVAAVHEVGDVGEGGDGETRQVLHVGAEQGVLPHPQPPTALGVQQVPHTLAVDLQVAHLGAPTRSGGPQNLGEVGA